MSQDEKTVFANVDLGSLARNSENIRLQQNIEEARSLPAIHVASEYSSDRTNIERVESSKPDLVGEQSQRCEVAPAALRSGSGKQVRVPVGGMLLALWIVVLCYLGGTIELGRTMALANIMQAFCSNPPSVANMLMQNDLSTLLLARHSYKDAYERNQKSIEAATAAYGANDQRTIFTKLNLALLYLNSGKEAEARKIWQAALPFLDKPTPVAPKEMTDVLLHLAWKYDDNDSEAARSLYLATLNFWPHGAGSGTISNVRQDLALADEELGYTAEANENMRKAYAAFKSSGDTPYNQFRLYHIALTYNDLGKYYEAQTYAKSALEMARRRSLRAGTSGVGDALLELGVARSGLGNDKSAIDAFKEGMEILDLDPSGRAFKGSSKKDFEYWAKYYLALANSYRRTGNLVQSKEIYHNIVTELGKQYSTSVVKEAARNYNLLTGRNQRK